MWLSRLALTDFRSYPSADLQFSPGVTTFVGPNGHGKTNLLEAVGYLSTLGSHRVATDAALVRRGASQAYLRAVVARDERELLVELELNPGRANRVRVNRAPLRRPRELLGLLRTVLFAPEDLAIVKGDPAERRRFLDELLVARAPRYAGVRADYDRVLRQRNALLKSLAGRRIGTAESATLDSWDVHLADAGAQLVAARLSLVDDLRPWVDESYRAIAGRPAPVGASYVCSLAPDGGDLPAGDGLPALMLERLAAVRGQEAARGLTLVGPHRDELALELSGLPARGYASHGESWSLALALRLSAYRLLASDTGGVPVLLLDDVFAELDSARRSRLAELVAGAEQVLITAAAPEDVPALLEGSRFDVQAGEVRHVA